MRITAETVEEFKEIEIAVKLIISDDCLESIECVDRIVNTTSITIKNDHTSKNLYINKGAELSGIEVDNGEYIRMVFTNNVFVFVYKEFKNNIIFM